MVNLPLYILTNGNLPTGKEYKSIFIARVIAWVAIEEKEK